MDVQRGTQEGYWKRIQDMSGDVLEKMDWVSSFWRRLKIPNLLQTRANESMATAESFRVDQVCIRTNYATGTLVVARWRRCLIQDMCR